MSLTLKSYFKLKQCSSCCVTPSN